MKNKDGSDHSFGRLTDFAVCNSLIEADLIRENSDLPATAFDQREIYDYSQKKHRILVYACPGCRGGA